MASPPKRPSEMTEQESLLMDTAMSSYRHVKQPMDDAFEAMLKSLRSPFDVASARCTEESRAAATCFQQAAVLGKDGEQEMLTAALKCREPVAALERCAHSVEAQAFQMMRDGHRRMEEAQKRQQSGPVLNTD
eukprot:CAMPEP_0174853528 /NCGR_PEP_ID=MMETSP1114-20130205/28834_1 /TAXON_ID=312471 /ORGANISM="Neobodo designis, Strain CCAP 1951/1" /LENGTH=132 /DNA_ID=CAMNT_0016088183 /DNA_START=58 /DNA_END=456 /DNA_ORIENTATION=+